jgi:hypothetical protein
VCSSDLASFDGGIIIELIIPYYIVEIAVIYLVERSTQWVGCSIAYTAASLLEGLGFIAGIRKLLTEGVILDVTTKHAFSLLAVSTTREGFGIEFENEPPVDRMAFFQEG